MRHRLRPRAEGLLDAAARALNDEAALSLGGQGCRWKRPISRCFVKLVLIESRII